MSKFKRISKGTVKRSFAQLLVRDYFSRLKQTNVAVPLQMSKEVLFFDFNQEIQRLPALQRISKDRIASVIGLLAKSLGRLDETWLKEVIAAAGFKESQEETDLIRDLRSAIVTSLGRSGVSNLIVKDVLQAPDGNSLILQNAKSMTMPDIATAIRHIQSLYSRFAQSESVESISSYLSDSIANDPVLGFTNSLYSLFHLTNAPSAPVNLAYTLNSFFGSVFKEPYMAEKTILPGYEYALTAINVPTEITYGDCVFLATWGLRTCMGIQEDIKTLSAYSIEELLANQVSGAGVAAPFMLKGLKHNPDRCSEIFTKMFFLKLCERVASGDFGNLEAKVRNVIDSRKYERSDAFDKMIKTYLSVSSVAFESFLDTAAFFREVSTDYSVFFSDVDPRVQKKLNDFCYSFYGVFKQFNYPATHPRFLMEAATLVNHTVALPSGQDDYMIGSADDVRKKTSAIMLDTDIKLATFLNSKLIQGSAWDMPLEVPHAILSLSNPNTPVYSVSVPKPELLTSDIGSAFFSIMPLKDLLKKTKHKDWFLERAELRVVASVGDLMNLYSLPQDVATRIHKKGGDVYIDISTVPTTVYTYEYDLAPIYEVAGLDADDPLTVKPAVAQYPYLLEFTAGYFPGLKVPVKGDEDPLPGNPKKVQPPKTEGAPPEGGEGGEGGGE